MIYAVRDSIANAPDAEAGDVCIVDKPDTGEKLVYVRTSAGSWEPLPRWSAGTRLFDRLGPGVRPGDVVTLSNGQRARVDTAKPADDLKDAKCTVTVIEERS